MCRQPVKEENLGRHLRRAHPDVPRRKYRELGVSRARHPSSPGAVWLPVAVILVAAVIGMAVYFAATPPARGYLATDHTYFDMGNVPQGVVDHSFRLRNDGSHSVRIVGVWTSCGCTTAHVEIGSLESPMFGMHGNPAWQGSVPPGSDVVVFIHYDATYHDDRYVGERSVFVQTDNPSQPEIELRIHVAEG